MGQCRSVIQGTFPRTIISIGARAARRSACASVHSAETVTRCAPARSSACTAAEFIAPSPASATHPAQSCATLLHTSVLPLSKGSASSISASESCGGSTTAAPAGRRASAASRACGRQSRGAK